MDSRIFQCGIFWYQGYYPAGGGSNNSISVNTNSAYFELSAK
jgi:hypothetical protein